MTYDDLFQKWIDVKNTDDFKLLRTAILRDFAQRLHSHKSAALATSGNRETLAFHGLEQSLKGFVATGLESDSLQSEVSALQLKSPQDPAHPGSLASSPKIEKFLATHKLERYDRFWEREIALAAIEARWKFFECNLWVSIRDADSFQKVLTEKFWPSAVLLYVENAKGTQGEQWNGRWLGVSNPSQKNTLTAQWFQSLPGSRRDLEPPTVQWLKVPA